MSKPLIQIVSSYINEDGELVNESDVREMTDEEHEVYLDSVWDAASKEKARVTQLKLKRSAYEKLGLSNEEIDALLGAN